MIKYLYGVLIVLLMSAMNYSQNAIQQEIKSYLKDIPFSMKEISIPEFPKVYLNIKDYCARGDGQTLNTEYINKAIDDCSVKGGGYVIIPAGLWLTGPIELKSNVNLQLEAGALVFFSEDHKDYPLLSTNGKSYFVKNPIYGYELKNIAITGDGIFSGNGQSWRPVKKNKTTSSEWKNILKSGGALDETGELWYPSELARDGEKTLKELSKGSLTKEDFERVKEFLRPNLLELNNCKNVWIDGVTFQNSPKFSTYLRNCDNVLIRGVKIVNDWWTQNSDGIDLSSCKNVMIIKSTVNTGDDGICMKSSGKLDLSPSLENIIIADCIVYRAHGGFVIGSNTDGGIRNISVKNCNFVGTDSGLRFKSGIGRGGLVENIFIDNIFMKDIVNEAIIFDLTYIDAGAAKSKYDKLNVNKYPLFKEINISNIFCDGSDTPLKINRIDNSLGNIHLSNVYIKSKQEFKEKDLSGFTFKFVKFVNGTNVSFLK